MLPQEPLDAGQLYRLAWFFYLFLAVSGVLWIGVREGSIPLELFLRGGAWWQDVGLGLAGGALLIGTWRLMRSLSGRARELEVKLGKMLGPLQPVEVAGLALLSGFAEELFFRGAMQASWGWIPTTIVFALLHTGPGRGYRMWTLFAGIAGLLLAGLMLWRGNLMAPVIAHVLVNGVNLSRLETGSPAARGAESRAATASGDAARLSGPGGPTGGGE